MDSSMNLSSFNLKFEIFKKNVHPDNLKTDFDSQLLKLNLNCNKLYNFLHKYDYTLDHKANGFRSLFKICFKFQDEVIKNFKGNNYSKIESEMYNILLILNMTILNALKLNEDLKSQSEDDQLFYVNQMEISDLLDILKNQYLNYLHSMYGRFRFFWLTDSARNFITKFTYLMTIYSSSSTEEFLKNCVNLDFRQKRQVELSLNTNIYFLKNFWSLTENSLLSETFPKLIFKQPTIVKDILISKRQSLFKLKVDCSQVFKQDLDEIEINDKPIKCRLLWERNDLKKNEENLVFHAHGGGFISQSPNSHEIYLREWSKKLVNVPILSIDYSLSPQAKFPTALQQLLDCYFWLHSKDCEKKLGFLPRRILLCGDSAGGNLVTALILVLNDIKSTFNESLVYNEKLEIDFNFHMPISLVCVYAPLLLQLYLSPAKFMSAWDPILPLGVLLSCLEAYVGSDPLNEQVEDQDGKEICDEINPEIDCLNLITETSEKSKLKISKQSCEKSKKSLDSSKRADSDDLEMDYVWVEDNWVEGEYCYVGPKKTNFVKKISDSISKKILMTDIFEKYYKDFFGKNESDKETEPWYNCTNKEEFVQKIIRINKRTSNPYVSPLLYKKFDELKNVNLYLIALDYDVFLDDSITMTKCWKGKTILDVIEGLPHGFLNFNMFSKEAKNATDLVLNRIQQGLALED